jgi:hypothetical protein
MYARVYSRKGQHMQKLKSIWKDLTQNERVAVIVLVDVLTQKTVNRPHRAPGVINHNLENLNGEKVIIDLASGAYLDRVLEMVPISNFEELYRELARLV